MVSRPGNKGWKRKGNGKKSWSVYAGQPEILRSNGLQTNNCLGPALPRGSLSLHWSLTHLGKESCPCVQWPISNSASTSNGRPEVTQRLKNELQRSRGHRGKVGLGEQGFRIVVGRGPKPLDLEQPPTGTRPGRWSSCLTSSGSTLQRITPMGMVIFHVNSFDACPRARDSGG